MRVAGHVLAVEQDPQEALLPGVGVRLEDNARGVGGNGAVVKAERGRDGDEVDVVAREEEEAGLGGALEEVAQAPVDPSQQVVCLENAAPAKGQVLRQLPALPVHVGDDVANVLHGRALVVGTGQRLALAHEAHQAIHDGPGRDKLRAVPLRAEHLAQGGQQLHHGWVVLQHQLGLAREQLLVRLELRAGAVRAQAEVDVSRGNQTELVQGETRQEAVQECQRTLVRAGEDSAVQLDETRVPVVGQELPGTSVIGIVKAGPHGDMLGNAFPRELAFCTGALVWVRSNRGKDVLQRQQRVLCNERDKGMQRTVFATGRWFQAWRLATAEKVLVADTPKRHALSMSHQYGNRLQCKVAVRYLAFLPK